MPKIKELFRIQKERIYYKYHWLRSRWPVWFYLLNRQARKLYKKEGAAPLDAIEQRIANALKREGIAIADISELLPAAEWQELKNYVLGRFNDPAIKEKVLVRRSTPTARGDKYFNVDLLESPLLDLKNPFVRFCANDRLFKIVNNYLEMYAKFRGMRLWATYPVPENAPEHSSQQWHRDPEDKKMVKVFVYYNDIDENAGPFTYIKESQHGGRWRNVFPQRPPIGFYPPRGAVEKIIPSEYVFRATGKAGTVIFCDTSGLHKGGYCKSSPRYMSQSVFASSASIEPLNYQYPSDFDASKLSSRAQYALDN